MVTFNASEVAAVAGAHPYARAWEAACRVWRRHSRATFEASGVRLPGRWVDDAASAGDERVRALLEAAARAPPAKLESARAAAGTWQNPGHKG